MLVDIVECGLAPIYICNLSEDRVGYMAAPEKHSRTRGSIPSADTRQARHARRCAASTVHGDIATASRRRCRRSIRVRYFQKYGENAWAGVKGYLDACADAAATP